MSAPRVVVDTNVLVSAIINPRGAPGRMVDALRDGRLVPVASPAILAEYREVLARSRLGLPAAAVAALMGAMEELATPLADAPSPPPGLPDPDYWPFMAAALAAPCPLVTGNARHYPPGMGLTILSPAQCLERLNTPG